MESSAHGRNAALTWGLCLPRSLLHAAWSLENFWLPNLAAGGGGEAVSRCSLHLPEAQLSEGLPCIAGSPRGPLAGTARPRPGERRRVIQAEREQTGTPVICMTQMGASLLPAPMLLIRPVRGPQTSQAPSEQWRCQQPRSYPQQSASDPRRVAGEGPACPAQWASAK